MFKNEQTRFKRSAYRRCHMANDEISSIRRFAVLNNHLPRQCGIATFTTHLTDSLSNALPDADAFVVPINDAGRNYPYPARVRFEIGQGDLASYRRAADFLNVNRVDVGLARLLNNIQDHPLRAGVVCPSEAGGGVPFRTAARRASG